MTQGPVSGYNTLCMMVFPMFLHESSKDTPFFFINKEEKENLIIGMPKLGGFIKRSVEALKTVILSLP